MKNDAVALSFGYMAMGEEQRSDGVTELTEIDLYEISVVPAPANPDTRFLSLKSASPPTPPRMTTKELVARAKAVGVDLTRGPVRVSRFEIPRQAQESA